MQKLLYFVFICFIASCNQSVSENKIIQPLTDGFVLSSERGWSLPAQAIELPKEWVQRLAANDEVSMYDFYAIAEWRMQDDVRVLLWAKSLKIDAESGGILYLSVFNKANELLDNIDVINTLESEGGRFFDVFSWEKNGRFSKARFARIDDESDVLFRYEYSIADNGELKLEGEFVNRNAAKLLRSEKETRKLLVTEAGLSFMGIGEPFEQGSLPATFELKKEAIDGCFKLFQNGKAVVQFFVVNDLVEDIRVFNHEFITEKNISCGSTFSELKNAMRVLSVHCRGDEGVWAKVQGSEWLEFQLDVPLNISCNSEDEIHIEQVPPSAMVVCIRIMGL